MPILGHCLELRLPMDAAGARSCPNGHRVSATAAFCGTCGVPLLDLSTPGLPPTERDPSPSNRAPQSRPPLLVLGAAVAAVVVGGAVAFVWASGAYRSTVSPKPTVPPVAVSAQSTAPPVAATRQPTVPPVAVTLTPTRNSPGFAPPYAPLDQYTDLVRPGKFVADKGWVFKAMTWASWSGQSATGSGTFVTDNPAWTGSVAEDPGIAVPVRVELRNPKDTSCGIFFTSMKVTFTGEVVDGYQNPWTDDEMAPQC